MSEPDFSRDKRNAPEQPGYTCPKINDLIDKLEDLRKDNQALREHGDYWREKAEEYDGAYRELAKELEEAQARLAELENH